MSPTMTIAMTLTAIVGWRAHREPRGKLEPTVTPTRTHVPICVECGNDEGPYDGPYGPLCLDCLRLVGS